MCLAQPGRPFEKNVMNENNSEDKALSNALGAWRVTESLPPRFQERVWSRIEQAESVRVASPWEQVANWLNQLFARPAVATAYIAVLLTAGLAAGYLKANADGAKMQGDLAARYVQTVDPFGRTQP